MVFHEDPAFGRGPARIMELVRQTNKLSEAYRIMGLSSSKGWKIIKRAQNDLGFPPDRMAATGFGEYRPVALGNTEADRAQNRRIELKLTER